MDFQSTRIYRWVSQQLMRLGISPGKMKEFIKFAVVGGSGVLVNMGVLFVLTRYAGMKIVFASPIAIEVSILTNFFLNNAWTFSSRETELGFQSRILRYHLVTALAGVINYLTLLLLANVFGMHDLLANLIGIILGTFINFFLNSMWTWKINPDQDAERGTTSEPGSSPEDQK